jgi:prephenate dehydratase
MVADAEIVPCTLSADVFAALVEGAVEAAVIPIENSLAGSVLEHFDLLLAHDVKVVRETMVRIRHNLIACPGVSMDGDRPRLLPSGGPGAVPALPRGGIPA